MKAERRSVTILRRAVLGILLPALLAGIAGALFPAPSTFAESPSRREAITIPTLIDLERRIERRDLPRSATIRFVTEEDFPPFNYIGRDGALAGFNIDVARAICAELVVQCTIQPRKWDLLLPALDRGEADAALAGHRITSELRQGYEVSLPTHRNPARFVARHDRGIPSADLRDLAGRSVAIVGGSAHEAYLNAFFPALRLARFERIDQALEAMRRGEADLVFGAGIALSFWINGTDSQDCCAFVGGAFTESRYFGEGAGIVLPRGKAELRQAVDYALWRINRDGRYTKLYLKHFPVPYY